jgi:FkbH-like protein
MMLFAFLLEKQKYLIYPVILSKHLLLLLSIQGKMTDQKEIKCVVWDLDNTLWDGVLLEGDDVRLKPEIIDVVKTLDQRGILHSIASKNFYDDAMKKLREFKIDDFFLFPEIGWNSKSQSIAAIRENLNIGMDSFMFIDDEPFERDEVKSEHPDVTCIESSKYLELSSYPSLNPRFITKDSKRRRLMYLQDQKRKQDENNFKGPRKEFLASLGIHLIVHEAVEEDLKRAEELTVRTNQLNATGKTYSYDELKKHMTSKRHRLIVCELNNRYGSYGKIGLALVEVLEDYYHVKLLLMSCRVMSMGVGTILLTHIMQEARKDSKKVKADFRHTGRNRMMYVTFKFAGFREVITDSSGTIVMENNLDTIQEYPPYVTITLIDRKQTGKNGIGV